MRIMCTCQTQKDKLHTLRLAVNCFYVSDTAEEYSELMRYGSRSIFITIKDCDYSAFHKWGLIVVVLISLAEICWV